ncbi:MAG TPA: toll/interleukin-1 receptor domain-containing protein [Pyrinomonadaceae bacterium]|nr:toll/interleukin-1 receptor domain-containing protein [Pyrinomonadaceae bacterium]
MRERINKPRVFLSYARKDVTFIERVDADLRKCQVEPWRDEYEIRDGQPWMSAIFEDGIPTCDAILAYFTDNSLSSSMVAKEVDSAMLRRLLDSKVIFLPYVDADATRAKLRVDIQTLQCRVWNVENYYEILPSVVAEIWRSYYERNLEGAVATEKARRLELELELQKIQQGNSNVFNNQENGEFQFIYEKLNRNLEFEGIMYEATFTDNEGKRVKNIPGRRAAEYSISIPLVPLLGSFVKAYDRYDNWALDRFLYQNKNIRHHAAVLPANDLQNFSLRTPDLTRELYAYEFLERTLEERTAHDKRYFYFFTPKIHRFLFWCDYNKLIDENYPIVISKTKEN